MEQLSLQDTAPPNGPHAHQQPSQPAVPQAVPQLPPQMFTTAAQLLDLTDSEPHLAPAHTLQLREC